MFFNSKSKKKNYYCLNYGVIFSYLISSSPSPLLLYKLSRTGLSQVERSNSVPIAKCVFCERQICKTLERENDKRNTIARNNCMSHLRNSKAYRSACIVWIFLNVFLLFLFSLHGPYIFNFIVVCVQSSEFKLDFFCRCSNACFPL